MINMEKMEFVWENKDDKKKSPFKSSFIVTASTIEECIEIAEEEIGEDNYLIDYYSIN